MWSERRRLQRWLGRNRRAAQGTSRLTSYEWQTGAYSPPIDNRNTLICQYKMNKRKDCYFSMEDVSMDLRKSLLDFVADSFSRRSSMASMGVSEDNTLRRIQ